MAPATRSTITMPTFRFTSVLPVVDSVTDCRSNPIAHRVRRKRQRLPPSLLIENASDRDPAPPQESAPRRFRSRLATTLPELSPPRVTRCSGYNSPTDGSNLWHQTWPLRDRI